MIYITTFLASSTRLGVLSKLKQSLGEIIMDSNLFARKSFLDGNWMTANLSEYFSYNSINENVVVKINLLRATANEADYLKSYLSKIPQDNCEVMVIDLSNCNFIDSTFLSNIISFKKRIDAKVKLVVSDPRQLTIFKITKIDSLFNIYKSLDQAIAVS